MYTHSNPVEEHREHMGKVASHLRCRFLHSVHASGDGRVHPPLDEALPLDPDMSGVKMSQVRRLRWRSSCGAEEKSNLSV